MDLGPPTAVASILAPLDGTAVRPGVVTVSAGAASAGSLDGLTYTWAAISGDRCITRRELGCLV